MTSYKMYFFLGFIFYTYGKRETRETNGRGVLYVPFHHSKTVNRSVMKTEGF